MKKAIYLSLLIILIIPSLTNGQNTAKEKGLESITMDAIKGSLEFLASDWTEGRETGERGSFMAADYIQSMFKVYGIEPAGDFSYLRPTRAQRASGEESQRIKGYFQDFSLIKFKAGKNQVFQLKQQNATGETITSFKYLTDFSFSSSEISQSFDAEIVFVGYGYKDDKNGYDDYKNIDVRGKIALLITGFPGHNDKNSDAYKKFNNSNNRSSYYLSRLKSEWAKKHGAVGIIEYYPESNVQDSWAKNYPLRYESRGYEGDTPLSTREYSIRNMGNELNLNPIRITLSNRVINEIIKNSKVDFNTFEETVKMKMKPASLTIPNLKVHIYTDVESEIIKARNVLGMIEGEDLNDIIVIGGHYDHLGIRKGFIYNGADDDASGVVGMLTIARAIKATGKKPKRTIIFAAWTGEEKGLLGSKHFVETFKPLDRITYNLNMDMISRNNPEDKKGNQLTMKVTKGNDFFEQLSTQNIEKYKLTLEVKYNPIDAGTQSGGSDYTPFCAEYIPFFSFNAGFDPNYHHYDDEVSTLNWEKMLTIVKLGFLDIWDLANY